MATAKGFGVKAGSLAGKGAGLVWNTTCRIAAAAGDAGEGFLEGAEQGWEESMRREELRKLAAKAKLAAAVAERVTQQQAPAAQQQTTAAMTPVAG